ncbi:LexA signal peptidase [Mycena albidolilacea]|uniref:Mitochondrial inner membrane protease subunit n=1 Tax=Mycena albidolilacea TaxID=1033008 RepID=A0AAD7F421_9AGAR|nr:LexA signal peptidase [Mycena albidolilacea]
MPHLKRALSLLYWAPAAVLLTELCTVKRVSGRSMQPTLNPDSSLLWRDVGIFDRYSIHTRHRRGDIVVLKSPENPRYELIKRIIAIEGDTVYTRPPYLVREVRIPKNHVWVEGDGFHSQDSNSFGPVPLGLVDSRLLCLIWPVWRLGSPTGPVTPNLHSRVTPARSKCV